MLTSFFELPTARFFLAADTSPLAILTLCAVAAFLIVAAMPAWLGLGLGLGLGSGHSKKLLAKKLLVSGKKMQAQKQLRIARSAKGERASTSSEHLRMGSSGGAPGGGLTKQGLAKIEADAKRAGLKAGFKAGMAP